MLPPELVRYIYEFVVPVGVSWRMEHHLKVIANQARLTQFQNIRHHYVDELPDRYSVRPSLKGYVNASILYKDDIYNLKKICCTLWIQERKTYVVRYLNEVYERVWNPYRPVEVLGRQIKCTISNYAYTRLLMVEAMFANGFVDGNWAGCVPRDAYCTECIVNWSMY